MTGAVETRSFDEPEALARDAADPAPARDRFVVPPAAGGDHAETAYFAGNSLGLQPKATAAAVAAVLAGWGGLAVEGHFEAEPRPWVSAHEALRAPTARLVGAEPAEIVTMNALTVNLHLLMASFYRPEGRRTRIVIEDHAFPSDSYAVRGQVALHGLDPDREVVRLRPRPGEHCLRTEDVTDHLAASGDRVALLLLGGVNYLTGELLDMATITAAGHAAGCAVGWDLAHAAGNVPLRLHDWDVDFAAWCTYKYLNAGPGAMAQAFVHGRHLGGVVQPRLAGWWGADPEARFAMEPVLRGPATADAWAVSTPSMLAMAPVIAGVELFDEFGLPALRARSERLTGYLAAGLDALAADGLPIETITPAEPGRRGCQLSIRLTGGSAAQAAELMRHRFGVLADVRNPDVIRLAPVPLYSSYHDCWRALDALRAALG